ncbi:MAG: DCC1-like thiol-disulfide oxidoreductase family protein [Candidatus Competibacteraceae bacterium]|jgi:predicted DCC family thiol-disulfide oxidoreductase YuxK|nr:DCC1-like thiol-disulfide oxidoreductase family protein [Candidatus Competibacteraceae bacterium]
MTSKSVDNQVSPGAPKDAGVTIIYDGDCPMCRSYVTWLRLRQSAGPVQLLDARQQPALTADLYRQGLDLDKGFVVRNADQVYHGAQALNVLALMSSRSGLFNRFNYRIFRSPRLTALLYPVLVTGRRLLLKLLGRKPIEVDSVSH